MLTERFLQFVKAEFNDFWQKSAKPTHQSQTNEQSMFESLYTYFMGKEQKTTSQQERAQAYQAYKRYRQGFQTASISPEEARHYNALELPLGAGWEEIKPAYKAAMKQYHPDRFAHDAEKQKIAQILAQKINEAYQYFEKKYANT